MRLLGRVMAVVVAVVLIGGLAYWARSQWVMGTSAAPAYVTSTAVRGNLRVVVSGAGNVVPIVTKTLRAGVAAEVGQVLVGEGQPVGQGELLIRLVNKSTQAAYEQALLDLELARLKLEELSTPAAADVAAAQLKVDQAELTLATRQAELKKLQVLSPATGRLAVKAEAGTTVTAGAVLGTVQDDRVLRLTVSVPVQYHQYLVPGLEGRVYLGTAYPVPIPAQIVEVAAEAVSSARGPVVVVTLEFTNPGQLVPGMTGSAQLRFSTGEEVSASGTLALSTRADVKAETQGTVVEWLVPPGETVEAGQVVARLDNENLRLSLRQAENDLNSARAALERLTAPDRAQSTEVRTQELKVRQAELTLESRRAELESLEVRAPFAGTVMQVLTAEGERVSANANLVTLVDQSRMLLTVNVDELDIARVHAGQPATITADALRGQAFTGVVTKVAGEGVVRDGVTTYAVTFRIDEPGALKPGMTVTADTFIAERTNVVLVPVEAVQEREGTKVVRVLDDEGVVRSVPVVLGLSNAVQVEVESGLSAGARVVVAQVTSQESGSIFGLRLPTGIMSGAGRVPAGSGGRW